MFLSSLDAQARERNSPPSPALMELPVMILICLAGFAHPLFGNGVGSYIDSLTNTDWVYHPLSSERDADENGNTST